MKKNGHLIIVSGPSGVGKGSICDRLVEKRDDVEVSISATTRSPRNGEVDGVNYYFVTEAEFRNMIESGELIEYSHHFGNYYGTPKGKLDEMLDNGKTVILEIDVNGGAQVGQKYANTVSVFILPPGLAELKKRIQGRGTETVDDINKRLQRVVKEIEYMHRYDYAIINGTLEQAVKDLELIVDSLSLKTIENMEIISSIKSEFQEMQNAE